MQMMTLLRGAIVALGMLASQQAAASFSLCNFTYDVYDYYDNHGYSFTAWEITSIDCSMVLEYQNLLDDPMWGVGIGDTVFTNVVPRQAVDWDNNPEPANCTDDEIFRRLHAIRDIQYTNILNPMEPMRGFALVTYDDGGTEVWPVISTISSDPTGGSPPVPNTLTCP